MADPRPPVGLFDAWMTLNGVSNEEMAERVRRKGLRCSTRYMEHLRRERMSPGGRMSMVLASLVQNAITAEQFLKTGKPRTIVKPRRKKAA